MTTTNGVLAALSQHIDESPSYKGISREAVDWRRTTKMVEEVGEAIAAYAGTLGENPRKGVTHTPADVEHELLDVAVSALGALMHRNENNPDFDVMGALDSHIRSRAGRLGLNAEKPDLGEESDGFHTFNEYFEQRKLFNAALFSHWAVHDHYGSDHHDVHKSRMHHDGTVPFENDPSWFVVVAQLPTGQISYHYRLDDWGLFAIPERDRAAEWDGHTAADAVDRLRWFLNGDY